jgi:hypothetical protein
MSQPENQELAQENGEMSNDDAVMAALLAKGEPEEAVEPAEEGEEVEEPTEPQEPEEEAQPEPPQDEDLEFELDGKPVKLKKSQLPEVYRNQMLDADYRRKTAEVAEAKRATQEEQQRIQQERNYYASQLDASLSLMQKQLIGDQEALVELARTNPAEWVAENAALQQRIQVYQAAVSQREQLSKSQKDDDERAMREWRKGERERLHEKLPEWRDTAKATAEQKLIAETLLSTGYTQEELGELFDHRALIVARKAALYDQLQAAKAKQAKPEPPKGIKPGAPKPPTDAKRSAYDEALAKAKRTGKSEDIERALRLKGT